MILTRIAPTLRCPIRPSTSIACGASHVLRWSTFQTNTYFSEITIWFSWEENRRCMSVRPVMQPLQTLIWHLSVRRTWLGPRKHQPYRLVNPSRYKMPGAPLLGCCSIKCLSSKAFLLCSAPNHLLWIRIFCGTSLTIGVLRTNRRSRCTWPPSRLRVRKEFTSTELTGSMTLKHRVTRTGMFW